MKKIKLYTEEFLKYSIGYTQIALSIDYETFWVIIEFIAQIQRIAMVFLFEEVLHILQDRRNIKITYISDYWVCKLFSKIFVPTIFLADMFSNNSIIALQIILIFLLCCPLIAIAIFIEYEKQQFATIQFRSQVGGPENTNLSINLLNRSYNMSNFIENFLYQQLMGYDQRSWLNVIRNFLAKLLNTYPHIFTIPLMYWNLLVVLLVIYDVDISNNQKIFMVVLDVFTTVEMIILWIFSMIAQRSYSMFDNNHLRLQQSTWFNMSQIIKFIPILVQFIYFLYSETQFDNSIQIVITCIIQMNLIGDLLDFFISIPYMLEYKQDISFLCYSGALTISISHEFQLTQFQLFSITLVCIPLITKMIKVLFTYFLQEIFEKQFFIEKKRQQSNKQSSQRKSQILEDDLQPFVIEKEQYEIKQYQIESLKNQRFEYFVHYLRYISFFRLSDQQSLDNTSNVDNVKRSNFLIKMIVLIKYHVANCSSVYCYCKGFRGEKRQVIDSQKRIVDTRILSNITINNIYIQVELIERYIRNFTKYVFEIENNKKNPNIFRLSQLLLSLCESEECYQIMTLIMDYKQKNIKGTRNNSMLNEIALTLIIGLAKHKVLQKMKNSITQDEVETGIRYKNYRITEIRRDEILNHLFQLIDAKVKFLKNLLELKLNFKQLYEQLVKQVKLNQKSQKEIENFQKYSNCRTSILIHMFYTLEVNCDFDKFIRLRNQLKTKNYKFFEYPNISASSVQLQGYRVLYLKTNLARHSINGQFYRGQIMDFSNNAPQILGYEPKEFKQTIQTVHQIVTANLAHYHDQLLEIFFLTNKPPILRKRRPLLMQKKKKELIFCEMYLDLSFNITEEAFPIYCFLKQIVPYGKYENVKGHIVLSEEYRIEGISDLALDQLKIKIEDYQKKGIEELVPNFTVYAQELHNQYEKYKEEDMIREEKGSTSNRFDYKQQEQLLVHFSIEVETLPFAILKYDSTQEIYVANCIVQMSIGIIHTQIYQAYLISIKKISLAENYTSSQMIDGFKQGLSQCSLQPLKLDSIRGLVDVRSESGDISDFEQLEHSNEDMQNVLNYQIPQIYSHFQTPPDSSRMILNSQREQQELQKMNGFQQNEVSQINDEIKSLNQFKINKMKSDCNQQQFYEIKQKHLKLSEIDLMDDRSGNQILIDKFYQNDTHQQHGNKDLVSVMQKSQMYSKFSQKDNTPKIIKVILMIDILNMLIIFGLTLTFYLVYKYNMSDNYSILEVFLPFTTTDYLRNSLLGLGQLVNQNDSTLELKITELISENLDTKLIVFQQVLEKQIVTEVLSSTQINLYDNFQQEFREVNAWTQLFQTWYQMNLFRRFQSNDDELVNRQEQTLQILINTFFDFIEGYENICTEFHKQIISNLNNLLIKYQATLCTITLVIEFIIVSFYSIAYMYFFRLKRRILRSCEQISIACIEDEKLRCQNIVSQYKNAYDMNIYRYQFNFKDKLKFDIQQTTQFTNLKISNKYLKTDTKKQFKIQDESYSYFQHPFVFYPLVGILICCFYLVYSLIVNYSQIAQITKQLEQFSIYINYCQEFSELCYVDYVIQQQNLLFEIEISNEIMDNYFEQLIEAYGEFLNFDEQFKYGYGDESLLLLQDLVSNVCSVITDSLCKTVINGKLQQGLLYSIQYYQDMLREDCGSLEKNLTKIQTTFKGEDLIAINFISKSLEMIVIEQKDYIQKKISSLLVDKFQYFLLFEIVIITIFTIQLMYIYRLLKNKFYFCRQLPYIMPPQAIYGQDSFLKSLQYIEKIYNNIYQ